MEQYFFCNNYLETFHKNNSHAEINFKFCLGSKKYMHEKMMIFQQYEL